MLVIKINGLEILTSTLKMRNGNIAAIPILHRYQSQILSVQNPPENPHNKSILFNIKVVDHDRCSFCDIASETRVECNHVSEMIIYHRTSNLFGKNVCVPIYMCTYWHNPKYI
jgi:hypothetical protein